MPRVYDSAQCKLIDYSLVPCHNTVPLRCHTHRHEIRVCIRNIPRIRHFIRYFGPPDKYVLHRAHTLIISFWAASKAEASQWCDARIRGSARSGGRIVIEQLPEGKQGSFRGLPAGGGDEGIPGCRQVPDPQHVIAHLQRVCQAVRSAKSPYLCGAYVSVGYRIWRVNQMNLIQVWT